MRLTSGSKDAIIKPPERSVDANPSLVAIQKAQSICRKARPVAVKNFRIDNGLELQIARRFEQPVAMGFKVGVVRSRAEDRRLLH